MSLNVQHKKTLTCRDCPHMKAASMKDKDYEPTQEYQKGAMWCNKVKELIFNLDEQCNK